MENEVKVCKHCKTEIPKDAKVCPNCRKKQGGKLKWIILAVIVLGVIGAALGGGDKGQEAKGTPGQTEGQETAQEAVEYTPVTVNGLMEALDENALGAAETYKDKPLEVTGELANIDSSGDYITLHPDDDFAIVGIQCYVQDDAQLEVIKTLKTGSTVTVRGVCTDVGEVLGYSLDIDEIVQ